MYVCMLPLLTQNLSHSTLSSNTLSLFSSLTAETNAHTRTKHKTSCSSGHRGCCATWAGEVPFPTCQKIVLPSSQKTHIVVDTAARTSRYRISNLSPRRVPTGQTAPAHPGRSNDLQQATDRHTTYRALCNVLASYRLPFLFTVQHPDSIVVNIRRASLIGLEFFLRQVQHRRLALLNCSNYLLSYKKDKFCYLLLRYTAITARLAAVAARTVC